jgi:predicted site-specific integrase-resolvase
VIVSAVTEPLVSTGEAAKVIGVGRATLARWWADGLVTPALVTAGGHARWDVEDLKRQLRNKQKTNDET